MAFSRLHLRVTISGLPVPVWRELLVYPQLSLADFHAALQVVMGWRDTHLHEFTDVDVVEAPRGSRGRNRWGSTYLDCVGVSDEQLVTVGEAIATGSLWYEYDLGDGWTHRIDVVGRVPDAAQPVVVVLDGSGRAPFEDSGGPRGYAGMLAMLADRKHPEHAEVCEWVTTTVGPWAPDDPHFLTWWVSSQS